VTQDTILFADTVYNNIAYATPHANREAVLAASRQSYADEFISQLPEGYNTLVGQSGVRLSGGQRQRIAIARAILRDPAILLLDEAMSQIDTDSEQKINSALKDFMRSRTTFVIAHRLSTIMGADLIISLDFGRITGIGTHQELLTKCVGYRRLCESQFAAEPASV
jgi:ABC-type multidrug transport system fused ATPase/permease subunit